MTDKTYPLHHTDAVPLYHPVTEDDYRRLKSENEELKEKTRWHKVSEELPEDEGDYLVMARYPDEEEPHIEICFYDSCGEDFGHYERRYSGSGDYFGGFDGEEWVTHNVTHWMPLPESPEDK